MQNNVKNKYQNYFDTHSDIDFKYYATAEKRGVWIRTVIDNNEFDVVVWTNQQKIKIYVNTNTSNEKTIAWFKEHMADKYSRIKFNSAIKNGKQVVVLDEYSIKDRKQFMNEYQYVVEDTFNKFLAKISKEVE